MTTRTAYHQLLDDLWNGMAELARLDAVAIERASRALIDADRALAELVISEQAGIAARAVDLEDRAADLIARQQPVATDLRLAVSTIMISPGLARMGGLARHIASTSRLRSPHPAIRPEMVEVFSAIGLTAVGIARDLTTVLSERDLSAAVALQDAEARMDQLHRSLFVLTLAPTWQYGMEPAIDAALLGRFYERFADQAVTVARRVRYVLSGAYPTW